MATLLVNNSLLTIYGDDHISVLNFEDNQLRHLKNSTSNKQTESSKDPYLGLIRFCAALSNDGKWYAVADDRSLFVWSTSDWTEKCVKVLERAASKIIFTPTDEKILVADKTGDVYAFSLCDSDEKGVLLLGHLSILLDMCMSPEENYIVTCDRDEKIRVTCYPNTYNIKCFCLGHDAFVTSILIFKDYILLSSSGDGCLKFWDLHSGKCLSTYFINENMKNTDQCIITKIAVMNTSREKIICLSIYNFDDILVFKCGNDLKLTLLQNLFCNEPLDFAINGNLLWILNCSEVNPLQAFIWNEDTNSFCDNILQREKSVIDLVRSKCSYLKKYTHVDLTVLNKKLDMKEKSIERVFKKLKST